MLLGIDLGTTNVKTLVADSSGRPVARGSAPVSLLQSEGGAVEQDIEEIWQATLSAIRQALHHLGPEDVDAIGISSQGGAMQLLDGDGCPVGRVISWLDQRGKPFDAKANAELGLDWFLKRISHRGSWLAAGQLLRLRQQSRALLAPPNRIGFVGDVIVSRLCGRAAHDHTSAGLTLLYNPELGTYDPDLLDYLGIDQTQLPILQSTRIPAGGLLPGAAAATGLKPGTPISAAIHDQYASALATGAVQPGRVMIGTGTAWVLLAVSQHLPTPVHSALVCRHVVEGLHGQILSMVNGGSAVNWALALIGRRNLNPKEIDDLLSSCPPGSEGLQFWPFMTSFNPSALAPGTRGRLTGLQISHGPEHIFRGVVEGLTFELTRHLDILRAAGLPVHELVIGGGAASSNVTPQMLADITGLKLRSYTGSESSVLGAVILARGLLESETPLAELTLNMKPETMEVSPGPNRRFYELKYLDYLSSLPRCTE